jgi:hypothetical protein
MTTAADNPTSTPAACDPKEWLAHYGVALDWTRRLFEDPSARRSFDAYASLLGVDTLSAGIALRKLTSSVLDVCAEALVGRSLGDPIAAPGLLWTASQKPGLRRRAAGCWPRLRLAAYWVYLLARVLAPRRAGPPRPNVEILFDQFYGHLDDQEFLAFYRYFKTRQDVVYSLPNRRCGKFRFLIKERRAVLAHRWGVPLSRKPVELARLIKLARLFLTDNAPLAFKRGILTLIRDRLRVESLLEEQPAKRFLRVRADMEPSHPLITGVCRARETRHIGYSCGSYPQETYRYAHLHFDDYGLFGAGFREIYRDWPNDIRYEVLGPFTAELEDTSSAPVRTSTRPLIAVFPTSYDDRFFMQRSFYEAFVRACVEAARSAGAELFFKEKDRTHDHEAFIATLCGADVPFTIGYNVDGYSGRRAPEIMAAADAVLVMGSSTSAWEALALGRKMLVFEQAWASHPFETVEPKFVVHDGDSLGESLSWLLGLSRIDYAALVRPVVERWAKASNGRLVQDFIESISRG